MVALSALHIDAQFDEAQLEVGIRWARKAADKGDLQALHNLAVGYTRRLDALATKPQRSPGAHWRSVLTQLDWRFENELSTHNVSITDDTGKKSLTKVDRLFVHLRSGTTFPMFVTHEPCLPLHNGIDLLCIIARTLAGHHREGFFLLGRRGLFIEDNNRVFVPIYVFVNDQLTLQTLWTPGSPDLILEHAKEEVEFLDKRFGNGNCMIPIAVNALDEGFVVAQGDNTRRPWVGVGAPWRMPFVDESQLESLGIVIDR
jgi:hypothetical protein